MALVVVCLAGSVGYVEHAGRRASERLAGVVDPGAPAMDGPAATLANLRSDPHVLFRTMAPGETGLAAVASLDAAPAPLRAAEDNNPAPAGSPGDTPRLAVDLKCVRVYFAGGRGLCLTNEGRMFTPWNIVFLRADLRPYHTEALAGIISRARISPDGRYGAATAFISGHSYAPGTFSTQTTLYDMANGDLLEDVEGFEVYRDGSRIESPDFNFWGVTFTAEPGRFYATLGTGDHTYLVHGDIATLRVDVVRDGVECPSVSPDGTRLAFKQRVASGDAEPRWRPAVLDLGTLEEHPLAETRTIDDQIEWLDDDTVLYAVDDGDGPADTFATPADGSGKPRLFLQDADSPSVVRPAS